MVRKATSTLTIGKSKTLLLEQQILGLNRQLIKLNSKVESLCAWIFKKFGVSFLDEAFVALERLSVHNSASQHSSLNPGLKKNEATDSDEQHSENSGDGGVIVVESDVDDDCVSLKASEPEIRKPPQKQHKRKDQQNKLFRLGVKVNDNKRTAEARKAITDRESKAQSNAPKHYCEWPDCKYSTSQKPNLERHKRTHSGEKPFRCTWQNCSKSFASNSTFRSHVRVHTGDKPYICDWSNCGKSFTDKSNVQRHWRTHTGERPFKCTYCNRRYGQQKLLTDHVRTHTGEKPFICTWTNCGESFAVNAILLRHRKTHTEEKPYKCNWPFQCNYCYRQFGYQRALTGHVRTHTGEKPYICETCGVGFATSSGKGQHQKCHSKNH